MAGFSNLTQQQLLEVIAVLINNISVPFPNTLQNGLITNPANQIQFPDNPYNQNLGANLIATGDGTNIYLQLMVGQPAVG
jgi:hypothetical protein